MVKEIDLTDDVRFSGLDDGNLTYNRGYGYVSVDDADINRIEVIGSDEGREYVRDLKEDEQLFCILQDDNRTMKIFIDKVKG